MDKRGSAFYLDRLELLLLCTTAFLIPVYVKITPIIIAVLALLFFIRPRNYKALKISAKNIGFWAMLLPFILYIIGLAYSDDISTALKNTESALSLLAFPFIATAFKENEIENKNRYVKMAFVAGVIIIMIFCSIRAIINYKATGDNNYLYYTGLIASPHHHSYYALFAFIMLVLNLFKIDWKNNKLEVAIEITLAALSVAFIGILSSKISLILLAVFVIYILVKMLFSKKIHKAISISALVCIIALGPALYSIPMVKYRFDGMFTSIKAKITGEKNIRTITDSTTLRFKCLESVLELTSQNYLIGTGQGDLAAEMEKQMKKRMGESYSGPSSPHNQFLRSFASFGIAGIASLLLLFGTMLVRSIKQKDKLFIWWTIINIIFFCIEDMFCIINGIIFFSLFTSLFLMEKKSEA